MNFVIYFIIVVGILVFVHEFGHFAAAKICKMRVDVFALGFGKRLFGWNKLKGFSFGSLPKDIDLEGNTDYRISLLPLGGYVKIAGMIDESFDKDFLNKEPQPYEFRSRPTFQKIFVISAGVLMNFLLAFIILWNINFFHGEQIAKTTTIGYVEESSPAYKFGFQTNDKILSINNINVSNWKMVVEEMLMNNIGNDIKIVVDRAGIQNEINLKSSDIIDASKNEFMLQPAFFSPYILEVDKDSPAEKGGIIKGDFIIKINEQNLNNVEQAIKIINANPNTELLFSVLRQKDTLLVSVTPNEKGKIGVALQNYPIGDIDYISFGFWGSFDQTISDLANNTVILYNAIASVFSGDLAFNQVFGGPLKIAEKASESADAGLLSFLAFIALLSFMLAIINILPFPALDGGHLLIIGIEGIIRRELPVKVKIAIQNVGFFILLALMAFIIYNDIISI
ncbi:MAG: RIP metalloprotease RseP [Ignavibacteriales bacterium]|nr:RIP metalloprotease RseP [Ignavibacteriales bacterium]